MFVVNLKDGSSYSEKQGYWDTCPDTGITSMHLTLPFAVKKRLPDGTVEELDPSTVELHGYEAYYFANKAKAVVIEISQSNVAPNSGAPVWDGQVMAGVDYTHGFVLYVDIDLRGNVRTKRFTVQRFMDEFRVNPTALRKGAA